jgi:hypothetical protein
LQTHSYQEKTMAYVGSELALPSLETPRGNIRAILSSVGAAPAAALRKLWIYHRTLADLDGYSERNLLDLGAAQGVEEFARRAAGL